MKGSIVQLTSENSSDFLPDQIHHREWQINFYSAFLSRSGIFSGRKHKFFPLSFEACPGAGKSKAQLSIAYMLYQSGYIDWVIILTPYSHLVSQMMQDAHSLGMRLETVSTRSQSAVNRLVRHRQTAVELEPENRKDNRFYGNVLTYQSMNNPAIREFLKVACSDSRVMVCLDECHHSKESKTWGQNVISSFSNSLFQLACSGTFISKEPLSFVSMTEAKLTTKTTQFYFDRCFSYGYLKAVDDEICSKVTITKLKPLNEDGLRRTDISNEAFVYAFTEAHKKLTDYRDQVNSEAKGLLIVSNDMQANIALDTIEALNLEDCEPMIITQKSSVNSQEDIENFKNDETVNWCIAVDMMGEGVDIPDLMVGLWFTEVYEPLAFQQFFGRFTRLIPGLSYDRQVATIYAFDTAKMQKAFKSMDESFLPGFKVVDRDPSDWIPPGSDYDARFIETSKVDANQPYSGMQTPNAGSMQSVDFDPDLYAKLSAMGITIQEFIGQLLDKMNQPES